MDLFHERGEMFAAPPAIPSTSAFKVLTHRVALCGLIYPNAEFSDLPDAITCPKCVEQLAQRTERVLEAQAQQAVRTNCNTCKGLRVVLTEQGPKPCHDCR